MRLSYWLSLAFFLGTLGVASAYPDPTPTLPPPPKARPAAQDSVSHAAKQSPVVYETTVEGNGQTADFAQEIIRKNACEALEAWLQERDIPFRPDYDYLRQHGMLDWPPKTEPWTSQSGDEYQRAKVKLTVTEDQLTELKQEGRKVRSSERQHWAVLGLAGAVAMLAVFGGYLRLESATKGYYTMLLRAAVLALLGLIGAGLLMVA